MPNKSCTRFYTQRLITRHLVTHCKGKIIIKEIYTFSHLEVCTMTHSSATLRPRTGPTQPCSHRNPSQPSQAKETRDNHHAICYGVEKKLQNNAFERTVQNITPMRVRNRLS
jgi:hypothetical protein